MKETLPLIFVILTLTTCCEERDEALLSKIPSISFHDISYQRVGELSDPDTLSISFTFKDGDADLGLEYSDNDYPFHKYNFYTTSGELMTVLDTMNFNYLKIGDNDTLPEFTYCNYMVFESDTIYYQNNRFYYNLVIDFYTNDNGEFKKFDFTQFAGFCGPFAARFPYIDSNGKILAGGFVIDSRIHQGTIKYKMFSRFWDYTFGDKTLKLKVQINDRALNQSNRIETPPFTLDELANN